MTFFGPAEIAAGDRVKKSHELHEQIFEFGLLYLVIICIDGECSDSLGIWSYPGLRDYGLSYGY